MVRSGFSRGVPLYSRTTIEPYSVVFVPIGGGMMQPYERRRTGEIAGTSGSTVSALPVEIPSAVGSSSEESPILQAPAPPVVASQPVDQFAQFAVPSPQPAATRPVLRTQVVPPSPAVGTTGRASNSSAPVPTRIRPQAANGIFVEFNKSRWYSSGPPGVARSASPDPNRRMVRFPRVCGSWRRRLDHIHSDRTGTRSARALLEASLTRERANPSTSSGSSRATSRDESGNLDLPPVNRMHE